LTARLRERRSAERTARQLLIHGVCRYRRGAASLTALAWQLHLSLSGPTIARDRIEQRLRRDRTLAKTWRQVQTKLADLYGVSTT
jgi:hypothetical protein